MTILNVIYSILILLLTIIADFFLKKAANMEGLAGWKFLLTSAVIYFVSTIGWFFIYKNTKFITLGTFYSLGHLMLTIIIGLLIFKEKINTTEIIGIILGFLSLCFLVKSNNA